MKQEVKSTFEGMGLYFWLTKGMVAAFSAFMGIDQLWKEARKKGVWSLELPRFLWLGLPFLYLSTYPYLMHWLPFQPLENLYWNSDGFQGGIHLDTIATLALGYVVISSFYKRGKGEKVTFSESKKG